MYCKLHTFQIGGENNLLVILWEVKSHLVLAQIQQLWTNQSQMSQARMRFPSQSFRCFGEWRNKYFLAALNTSKFKSWKMNEITQTDSNDTTYCEKWAKKLYLCHFFIVLHLVSFQAFVFSGLHTKTKLSGISLPTMLKFMEDLKSSVGFLLQSPKIQALFAPLWLQCIYIYYTPNRHSSTPSFLLSFFS